MVQMKVLIPALKPVTVVVGLAGFIKVPFPLTFVHIPVPVVGVLPFNAVVVAHAVWSLPAFAVVGLRAPVITTVSADEVQLPLEMVHKN